MRTLRTISALLMTGILVLGLTGCSAKNDVVSSSNAIKVMLSTTVQSLDTAVANDGEAFEVIADCMDGLTQMDESGSAAPALAESWEVSSDGLTYTFHLRDAKWTNGDPVTAGDFVFAWTRCIKENEAYGYLFTDIAQIEGAQALMDGTGSSIGVTALDSKTLQVKLAVPVSYFESLLYFPTFYPINENFYKSIPEGTYGTSADTILCNGAYKVTEFTPGGPGISVVKNPDYYNASSVSLDGIRYQVVGSSDNAMAAFNNKTLDVVTISGKQVVAAQSNPELASNVKVVGAGYMWYLTFNQTTHNASGYLGNKNMRLAITNAIDRKTLVDKCVMDGSLPTYTAVPPQFAVSTTTGKDFSEDQSKFAEYCGFNVDNARSYLDKAKLGLGQQTFTFTLIYGNNEGDEVYNVATEIKAEIEKNLPGVTINLEGMPKKDRLTKIQNDDYEIALTRWGPDYADPMTYLAMWTTGNSNNYGLWSNTQYDSIIKDCTTGAYVTNYDARWSALLDAETIVMEEAVIAPLYTKANATLISSDVVDIDFHPVAINRVYKRTKCNR
ncbi:MAG: peptide ABC transporter substrate-binding protein [Lachnospiraceae bacterium]|nr:peptide ABC transporter substrate-binding protein [Lachnospiraceae bacterium]